jgi:hypothetical protein
VSISREGHGGLALGVCLKLFLMLQALPEYVIEARSAAPRGAATALMTELASVDADAASDAGAVSDAGAASDAGGASVSGEQPSSSNAGRTERIVTLCDAETLISIPFNCLLVGL